MWRIEAAPAAGRATAVVAAAAAEYTKVNAADQGQMQNAFAKLNKAGQSSKGAGCVDAFPVDMASGSSWPARPGVNIMLLVSCCAVLCYAKTSFGMFNIHPNQVIQSLQLVQTCPYAVHQSVGVDA